MEGIMLELMYDLPHAGDIAEVVINAATIKGDEKPTLKRKKGKKAEGNAA
jgi:ATP-dependent protease Clp ATPase subunit